jgi:hypothetical protein
MARDGAPVVPKAEPETYYGRPVIKEPVWTKEIPWYFWVGGMAGASAPLATGARLAGNEALGRRAAIVALAGAAISPVLLISDLGRPERFLHMLRMFKVTSPMSVGSWVLAGFGPASGVAAGWQVIGFPRGRVGVGAGLTSAFLGPWLSTYTAVLIANTAVPVWHDARHVLPFVFAGSSLASAGGAACALTPVQHAAPARALAVAGGAMGMVGVRVMEHGLDDRVRRSYEDPAVKKLKRAAQALTAGGIGLVAARGRSSRAAAVAGGVALAAGAACERWAIFQAGRVSARDPVQTVGPQLDRLDGRHPVKKAGRSGVRVGA